MLWQVRLDGRKVVGLKEYLNPTLFLPSAVKVVML